MNARALPALLAALTLGLLVAGGQALAAPPPTVEVSIIGHGMVTGGSAINCGNGALACATALGSDSATLTLTESPRDGWTFDHWEDSGGPCDNSTTTTCAETGTGDHPVFAVFKSSGTASTTTLNVSVNDPTAGEVTDNSTTYPLDCGTPNAGPPAATTCSLQVFSGSTITVTQRANDGFFFKNWGAGCSGARLACSVSMNAASRNVSADFVSSATHTLEIDVNGAGTVSGGGVNCTDGAVCTIDEPSTSTVSLTATPDSGYAFTGWDGACQGTQNTCSVDMSSDHISPDGAVIANFAKLVPVLLTVNGAGTVSGAGISCGPGPSTCSANVAPSTTIQFQATPTATGGTVTWSGCTGGASGTICNVVVGTAPVSVTTTFSGGSTGGGGGSFIQLGVNVSGNGYVTATSGQAIWCTAAGGPGCSASVQQNTIVTLHAVPASGSTADFNGWGGACTTTSTTCTVTMATAKSVTASFAGDNTTQDLTVSLSGSGAVTGAGLSCRVTGSPGCTSPEAQGANVTISATPGPGQVFVGWSGDCTGSTSTCTLSMDSDQNVTATFKATVPQAAHLTLTINGAGTVKAGTTSCVAKPSKKPTSCTETVKAGASVEVTATPAKGYVFTGWKGACTGTKPCTVVLETDAALTATFVPALAAGAKKPTVARISSGFRVTISFRAGEAGRLTVTSRPKSATVRKTVKAGAGTVRLTVKRHGRYVITLSLRAKSGTYALRYVVKV